jgi:hypothetical protein
MSGPPLVGDRSFRNQLLRISDLVVHTSVLEGYEFLHCRIVGPAILAPLNNVSLLHCSWDAPGVDAIFWEVPPERGPVVGVIGVVNCAFSNCRFELIGIAGPPGLRAQLESGFSSER